MTLTTAEVVEMPRLSMARAVSWLVPAGGLDPPPSRAHELPRPVRGGHERRARRQAAGSGADAALGDVELVQRHVNIPCAGWCVDNHIIHTIPVSTQQHLCHS